MSQNIVFVLIFVIYALIAGGIGIAIYVLRSLGLYKLAKNRGIDNAWLAWLPVGDAYIMGYLSEASPFVQRKFPKMHIIFTSVMGGYFLITIISSLGMFLSSVPLGPSGFNLFGGYGYISLVLVFIYLIAIFVMVLLYFVLYHIYKTYDPQNAVLYTVLSVFGLSFIFLFVIRNKQPQTGQKELTE